MSDHIVISNRKTDHGYKITRTRRGDVKNSYLNDTERRCVLNMVYNNEHELDKLKTFLQGDLPNENEPIIINTPLINAIKKLKRNVSVLPEPKNGEIENLKLVRKQARKLYDILYPTYKKNTNPKIVKLINKYIKRPPGNYTRFVNNTIGGNSRYSEARSFAIMYNSIS